MQKISLFLLPLFLVACSSQEKIIIESPVESIVDGKPENNTVDIAAIPDAVPQYEPWSASVNPESYQVLGKTYHVLPSNIGFKQQGIASWYGTKFHQKKTATGETYDMYAMTAAHKTLPIPSYVRVTNLQNQRQVIVRVNDRGPFHEQRIIDLSYAVAVKLGLDKVGTGFVEVVAVQSGEQVGNTNPATVRQVYMQIGAFGSAENAIKLQQQVADLRLTTSRIVTSKLAGTTFYKVQVGPISSVVEADTASKKLQSIGISQVQFVTD
ncbi:MAG: rare lipoprotein A [Methyloprofundus sp.]|nr:MAG: rare lipoprotein A [Methyloprofundus sp.]